MVDPLLVKAVCNPSDNGDAKTRVETHRRKLAIIDGKEEISLAEQERFVLEFIYTVVVGVLNGGRKSLRRLFKREIGYLFVEWYAYGVRNVSQEVKTMWVKPFPATCSLKHSDIKENSTIKSSTDADGENHKLYEKLVKEQQDMQVVVKHDVFVVEGHSSSKRPLKRMVSMIDVALDMLNSLCGFPKTRRNTDVLKYHSQALRTVYGLAIALRTILTDRTGPSLQSPTGKGQASGSGTGTPSVNANIGDVEGSSVGRMGGPVERVNQKKLSDCFNNLLAAPSDISRIISAIVGHVPVNVYRRMTIADEYDDAKSIPDEEEEDEIDSSDGGKESDDDGVKISLDMLDDDM